MKKLLLVVAMILTAATAFAAKKTSTIIIEGSRDFVKEKATVLVEVKFDEATWEVNESYKAWCGDDYETRCKVALESLVIGLNNKSKGIKASADATDAKYKLTCKAVDLERHQAIPGVPGQSIIYLTGNIEVVDLESNQVVCNITLENFAGERDFVITDGIGKMFVNLGQAIMK